MTPGDPTAPSSSVAVIGGGFCGTMVAAQLLRRGGGSVEVTVVERGAFSRGPAYGTPDRGHLLNVPASKMSAFPDEPEHFLRWVKRAGAALGYENAPETRPEAFMPRMLYGLYLDEVLKDAARGALLKRVADDAVGLALSNGAATVRLRGGGAVRAHRVVLALGNFPPRFPGSDSDPLRFNPRYVGNPWTKGALDAISPQEDVLIIGTGLTMADLVVSLRNRGHQGTVHAVSRHGLLPRPHSSEPRASGSSRLDPTHCAPRELLRRLRAEARRLEACGGDWRDAVDSLRPHTHKIWSLWPPAEKKRFMRHARVFWEIHRHRLPPEVHAVVKDRADSGRLKVEAARVEAYRERDGLVEVSLRARFAAEPRTLRVSWVVNGTGPESDFRRVDDPLVRDLLNQGLARPDPLGLGLDTDEEGALLDRDGRPSSILFALGPALKPRLWETTAVPDLRSQAETLARKLSGPMLDR